MPPDKAEAANPGREPSVEIIVPLAPGEREWPRLVALLREILPGGCRATLAAGEGRPADFPEEGGLEWLECPHRGRARQMNHAAARSASTHLWFVHADSRPDARAFALLQDGIRAHPHALHYFRLRFFDGGAVMRLNEWGANLRSRWFGAPFGDQALCVPRGLFEALGGYDERCSYGEDHLLVRRARRRGVRLRCIGWSMPTSARKYARHGWLRVVLDHQVKWISQALRDR